MDTGIQGRVVQSDGPRFWVEVGGREIPCVLRGRLKKEWHRVTSLVVVGDMVELELVEDGTGAIHSVLPRRTELSRVGFHGYVHTMAANVDLMLVVLSAAQPRFKRTTAERLILAGRRGGLEPVLIVNKSDLEQPGVIASWVEPIASSGTQVLLTSTHTGTGLVELRGLMSGRVSVLAGPSGVGKSSLVNALQVRPEADGGPLRTQSVSAYSNKGRHTTTASRLYRLPWGGYLADTPGIKEIGLDEEAAEDLDDLFPEITRVAAGCKFRDCTHTLEPRCAVKQAVAEGQIDRARYRSYLRLAGLET